MPSVNKELLSLEELQSDYLYGIPIRDAKDIEISDAAKLRFIKKAQRRVERDIDVCLTPRTYTREEHDYNRQRWMNWGHIDLYHRPVIDIESIVAKWPSETGELILPEEWFTHRRFVSHDSIMSSTVELRPIQGTFSQILTSGSPSGGPNLLPIFSGGYSRIPFLLEVTYTAGWPADEPIDDDVRHLIGLYATTSLLNIAGDITLGAGIASKSISIPGLAKSINTTQSATNAAFGARILQYLKEIKELRAELRDRYGNRTKLTVA